ncbi:unnamed protein product [Didymodactylos carnosus]|uniref:Tc1-like transposase DDE domain-containing protein n=1 Tax=Didymodactylos carnosus TaxID=1234261 RepID=A0A815BBI0_9BILA|nr:unnamed protein product [Didymodactylos carnosus]CAF1267940.1 unnamed protein product [Didymodactylos carnosus]CAF3848973.1 unnamed protein product [Didymodactylos carnosus]CAF4053081.1 unnamed protein product [Didymodactylos carnosus]
MTKAELLDVAYKNLPPKEYMADKAAMKHNVQLVRIPVKHCALNRIELVWASLKNFVCSNNVRFSLNDVEQLTKEFLSSIDPNHVKPYFDHVKKHEEIFKAADKIAEEMENDLIDEDEGEDNMVDMDSGDSD